MKTIGKGLTDKDGISGIADEDGIYGGIRDDDGATG